MTYEIETDVPAPPPRNSNGDFKATVAALKPGQSFFAQGKKIDAAYAAVGGIKAGSGGQYVCRKVDGGVRVWRTA